MKRSCHTKTLKVRIRDKHIKVLNAWSFSVNQVWNYCNELSHSSVKGGLKDTATCSDGTKLEARRFYRDLEPKLAVPNEPERKSV